MYEEFFGLTGSPFQLSPDPFFMVSSERSKEALASISDAIRQRKGFVVMTGEVGTGKTLVLRCLVELWEREEIPFAYFIGPRLSTVDFLSYITFELGINVTEPTKGNLLRALYGFLLSQFEKGLTTVLVIDEAHQMPRSVLEEIRLLTNFETAQQKLVQILLVGQPELDKKLDSVELRSLKQRIAVRCQLEPLREEEIRHYIERRLELAGADLQATAIFPEETIKAIYRYSLGIPRLVNSICDQALIAAYARQVRVVPVEVVKEVASRFRLDPAPTLKQTEKPLSFASQIESSVPDKSWQAVPILNVPRVKPPDPHTTLRHLKPDNERPLQTVQSSKLKLETSHKSSFRDDSILDNHKLEKKSVVTAEMPSPGFTEDFAVAIEPTFVAPIVTQSTTFQPEVGEAVASTSDLRTTVRSDQILINTEPFKIRQWLQPGLRLSIIICVVAVVPVALATGVFMARRQKGVVATPHQVVRTREAFPIEQTVASIQPAAASSVVPVDVGSADPIVSRTDSGTFKPTAKLEHLTPHAKVVVGSLSRPVLKSLPLSTSTEPPAIVGMQTKESDLEKGLLAISSSSPTPPTASTGGRSSPAPGSAPLAANMETKDLSAPGPTSPTANAGGHLQPAKPVWSPPPAYPSVARRANVRGIVLIDTGVDKTGNVTDMKVLSGSPLLTQAAMEALRTWKYEPARLNGQATATRVRVSINFSLP